MERTHKKIALLHHTGGGNLGDDATLDVVIRNINRRQPDAVITAFTMNPDDTAKRHGIPSYPLRTHNWSLGYSPARTEATRASKYGFFSRLLRATITLAIRFPRAICRELAFLVASLRTLRSFDLLIISGGGQLTERSGPWGFPYTIFKWVLVAKFACIRCVFLNVGAGPLTHPVSKFFVARALLAADYVSFRDDQSRTLAHAIGFTGQGHVFPDSVYSVEAPAHNLGSLGRLGQSIVGIAPMPYPYCDPRPDPTENQIAYDDFIAKLAIFASSLVGHSYSVALFGSDIGVDPQAIEDLREVLMTRHGISEVRYDPVGSVQELLSTISVMDYVVTCRFHGVVFAHVLNKPVLAISHHPKVANLMKDLGLSKYCVDISAFDPTLLMDTFASVVSDTDKIKSRMAESLASYKSQLTGQFDDLFPRCLKEPLRCQAKVAPGYQKRAFSDRDNS
jgi:polysaccharide pyruvyl transferase WcaK-like protein